MPNNKPSYLSSIGILIKELGLSLPFVIEKSGIPRSRLVYLRTNSNAELSFREAQALAPVFKMSLEELALELKKRENTK